LGAAHVSDLENISDLGQRTKAEIAALRLGEALVTGAAKFSSFEGVLAAYAAATR